MFEYYPRYKQFYAQNTLILLMNNRLHPFQYAVSLIRISFKSMVNTKNSENYRVSKFSDDVIVTSSYYVTKRKKNLAFRFHLYNSLTIP